MEVIRNIIPYEIKWDVKLFIWYKWYNGDNSKAPQQNSVSLKTKTVFQMRYFFLLSPFENSVQINKPIHGIKYKNR